MRKTLTAPVSAAYFLAKEIPISEAWKGWALAHDPEAFRIEVMRPRLNEAINLADEIVREAFDRGYEWSSFRDGAIRIGDCYFECRITERHARSENGRREVGTGVLRVHINAKVFAEDSKRGPLMGQVGAMVDWMEKRARAFEAKADKRRELEASEEERWHVALEQATGIWVTRELEATAIAYAMQWRDSIALREYAAALRERGAPEDAGWIDAVEKTASLIAPMDQPPGYPRIRKPEMSELSEIARNELGYEREFW
jgi:hypothetical protein